MKEDKLIIIRNLVNLVSKMVFFAQGGVSRPSARLTFCVGHHACPANLGLPPSHPSLTFDRDTEVQSLEIIFLIPNLPNEKTSKKQKKLS